MIRRAWPYLGSHWLGPGLVAVLLSICLAWFLDAVFAIQEFVERTQVDVATRGMRTGLQLAVGEAMMHGREREIPRWDGENPVRWLDPSPSGCRGECSGADAEHLAPGAWCFERESRQLVYVPSHGRHLRLSAESDGRKGGVQLRWRVVVHRDFTGVPSAFVQLVTPYSWQID